MNESITELAARAPLIMRAVAFGILVVFCVTTTSRAEIAVWAMESWECKPEWYGVQLGSGGDVEIRSIQGAATGSQLPGADVQGSNVRQSLTLILAAASLHQPAAGAVTVKPDGERVSEGLDPHILQVNLKQSGRNSIHLPLSYIFDPPIVVPDGKLSAEIVTETYASDPARLLTDKPYECLNTELHLTIEFKARPAPER
jgi:hypothetical protein